MDKDTEEGEEQPFNKPSVLYNEDLGGLEDEVVFLEEGEDEDTMLDNSQVLAGTVLADSSEESHQKDEVASHSVPGDCQEPHPV